MSLKTNTAKIVIGVVALAFAIVAVGSVSAAYTFNTNLKYGMKNDDVKNLQTVLGVSPVTGYFGPITLKAVKAFQVANNIINPGTGYVGPLTRNVLNGGQAVVPPPSNIVVTGGGLAVTAAAQPVNSLAPSKASRVPFTKFTLTAGNSEVTVNNITVMRTGLAQDSNFAGIVLLDENGIQLGTSKTLNSEHQAIIGEAVKIPANTSKTFTVAGNMATADASNTYLKPGEVAALSVVAVNTSATVSGSLPITGAAHTINGTLSLGTATAAASQFDPGVKANKEIGTTAYKFSGIKITQGGSAEKIKLMSIKWNQTGSASASDLANVVTVIDGVKYPTIISVDGKYYTSTFGSGIVIDKGLYKEAYIEGDIIGSGSANRTVKFDLNRATDVYVIGDVYGYGITPTASYTSSTSGDTTVFVDGQPWFDASKVTITAGSASTITKANSVAATNIATNIPSQVLGGFTTNFKGEPVSVQSMKFHFNFGSTDATNYLLTNVTLVDENGAVVGTPTDAVDVAGTEQKVTFTDTVTFPVGQKTYTLKGKVASGVTNGETITASTTPYTDWSNITGYVTGNTVLLTSFNTPISFNPMTIKTGALTIGVSGSPAAQTIVAGGQTFEFAKLTLDTTASGENLRISSLKPYLTTGGGNNASDLKGCQIFDGSTALNSTVVDPTADGIVNVFTFDNPLTLTKNQIKTLSLKCIIPSSADSTYKWGFSGSSPTATGVDSGLPASVTENVSLGQLMTVGTSALTITSDQTDAATVTYGVTPAGLSGVKLGVLKFHASYEAVGMKQIALQLTNIASSTASDITKISLFDGSSEVASGAFSGGATTTLLTFATNADGTSKFVVPKDGDAYLTVKADLADIDINNVNTAEGAFIAVDYDSDSQAGATKGTGKDSGAEKIASGSSYTAIAGLRMFKTVPTITDATTGTALGAGVDLYKFTVKADAKGAVQLKRVTFRVSTTTATATSWTLYGPSGAVNATPVDAVGATTTINFDTTAIDRIINAGQSKTYALRAASITYGGSGTNSSVVITMVGDTAYPTPLATRMGTYSGIDATIYDNFIWSPNATTTAVAADIDWTNGYGIPTGTNSVFTNNLPAHQFDRAN